MKSLDMAAFVADLLDDRAYAGPIFRFHHCAVTQAIILPVRGDGAVLRPLTFIARLSSS